eukprot:2390366-Amphidinium_carterae.3
MLPRKVPLRDLVFTCWDTMCHHARKHSNALPSARTQACSNYQLGSVKTSFANGAQVQAICESREGGNPKYWEGKLLTSKTILPRAELSTPYYMAYILVRV